MRTARDSPSSMVKRSRDQSHDAPRRFSWLMIGAAGLVLPLPDALDELVAAQGAAVGLLPLHQLALDHHLRGDAGMVGAGLPQHVAAAHALEADEHVLQRVVEGVAHMQRAGDVRRRDDDGEGPRPCGRAAGGEGAGSPRGGRSAPR